MLPPVDTHIHLLAGLDDGPRDMAEAVALARMLVKDGVRMAASLAHQSDHYPENVAQRLRDATALFAAELKAQDVALAVYPTGEVMLSPDLVEKFDAGTLLTMGDKGKFLLVEMPHGLFIDVIPIAMALKQRGVRLVIAHAERYPELTGNTSRVEHWIRAGCLIQITANEFAEPQMAEARVLRDWAKRGLVHMLGTDGHRLDMRAPKMKAGVEALHEIVGPGIGDRIANIYASNVLQGRAVNPPAPLPVQKGWLGKLMGK